jgi:hypothetical protein
MKTTPRRDNNPRADALTRMRMREPVCGCVPY